MSTDKKGEIGENSDSHATEEIIIEREGFLEMHIKSKMRKYYFILSGGGLYYKEKPKNVQLKGIINLKGGSVNHNAKSSEFELILDEVTYKFLAENEQQGEGWTEHIKNNLDKEPGEIGGKVKVGQSLKTSFKKNVGGKVVTSSAGKAILKEEVGPGGQNAIKHIKDLIKLLDNSKKATEIENSLLKLFVKLDILVKNGSLQRNMWGPTQLAFRHLWSLLLDYLEMPFAIDLKEISGKFTTLNHEICQLLNPYVTDKTISKTTEALNYFGSTKFLNFLFFDAASDALRSKMQVSLRTGWIRFYDSPN